MFLSKWRVAQKEWVEVLQRCATILLVRTCCHQMVFFFHWRNVFHGLWKPWTRNAEPQGFWVCAIQPLIGSCKSPFGKWTRNILSIWKKGFGTWRMTVHRFILSTAGDIMWFLDDVIITETPLISFLERIFTETGSSWYKNTTLWKILRQARHCGNLLYRYYASENSRTLWIWCNV